MTFPSLASQAADAFNRPNASAEITAQYQRGSAALIIALAPPDVAEAGAAIQRTRRGVVFIDFEKHGPVPRPARRRRCRSSSGRANPRPRWRGAIAIKKNFRFTRRHARQDETDHGCAAHGAMGDDGFFDQQPVNFVLTPATLNDAVCRAAIAAA